MKIPRFIALFLLILLVGFVTWDFTLSQQPLIKPIFVGIDDLKDVNTSGASDGNVLNLERYQFSLGACRGRWWCGGRKRKRDTRCKRLRSMDKRIYH